MVLRRTWLRYPSRTASSPQIAATSSCWWGCSCSGMATAPSICSLPARNCATPPSFLRCPTPCRTTSWSSCPGTPPRTMRSCSAGQPTSTFPPCSGRWRRWQSFGATTRAGTPQTPNGTSSKWPPPSQTLRTPPAAVWRCFSYGQWSSWRWSLVAACQHRQYGASHPHWLPPSSFPCSCSSPWTRLDPWAKFIHGEWVFLVRSHHHWCSAFLAGPSA